MGVQGSGCRGRPRNHRTLLVQGHRVFARSITHGKKLGLMTDHNRSESAPGLRGSPLDLSPPAWGFLGGATGNSGADTRSVGAAVVAQLRRDRITITFATAFSQVYAYGGTQLVTISEAQNRRVRDDTRFAKPCLGGLPAQDGPGGPRWASRVWLSRRVESSYPRFRLYLAPCSGLRTGLAQPSVLEQLGPLRFAGFSRGLSGSRARHWLRGDR
jgi:hypothetical protein